MSEPTLNLADIQGNIPLRYNFPYARYLFLRITDPLQARKALAELIPLVTRADWWRQEQKPTQTFNIAFTHRALGKLHLPAESLGDFPLEFRQGLLARASGLNLVRKNAPEHWDAVWKEDQIDVWMAVNAHTTTLRDEQIARVQAILEKHGGFALLESQDGGKLVIDGKATPKEHFGFTDGIGDPDIEGSGVQELPGRGTTAPGGKWDPIKAGEFLLGHLDEGGDVPLGPEPHVLSRNGSYLVFLKLHQNVGAFRNFAEAQSKKFSGGKDLFRAKLIGRWDDGTPLELSPQHADPSLAGDPQRNNDFSYENDPEGTRVPLGAHIRRMNPRDDFGFDGRLAARHRIARRGHPYGTWAPEGQPVDDSDERGMIFMLYNASIYRQFEFVWRQWGNYGNDFGLGDDRDPIMGNQTGTGSMIVPGDPTQPQRRPAYLVGDIPQFVEVRGGAYFFMPSLTALTLIAEGRVVEHLSTYSRSMLPQGPVPVSVPVIPPPPSPTTMPPEVAANESFWLWLKGLPAAIFHLLFDPLIAWAGAWAAAHPLFVFWVLRTFKPILVQGNIVKISRYSDVLEVLQTDTVFHVTYADNMKKITAGGDFFLGMQPSPEYTRDVSNMRLAARPTDVPTLIQPIVQQTALAIVNASGGSLNVATDLGLIVPTRLTAQYLGVTPASEMEFAKQASLMFRFLFIPGNPPDVDVKALEAAKLTRELIDRIIQEQKQSPGSGVTVLDRCLKMQAAGLPGLDDTKIRNNLLGLLIGMIPTTAKCAAQALDQLLDRPKELAEAQRAARQDNDELLAKYVFEALRFNPNNPALIRVLAQDYRMGGVSLRAGMIIAALTWSAMFDDREVDAPNDFRIDRPPSNYLHFGAGMHKCFGDLISQLQIPAILKPVLQQTHLRRAEGDAGNLQMSGPFPSSLIVEFDTPPHA